jgi:hypothetical protein
MPEPLVASEPMPRMRTTGADPVTPPVSTVTPGDLATRRSPRLFTGVISTF